MLFFLPAALALPPQAAPDLAFQQTPLQPPVCTPGRSYTWEVRRETTGRSHGRDIETGEEIDRPIASQMTQRVTLRCLDQSPARAALTFAVPDRAGGWSTLPTRLTISMPAANTYTIEPEDLAAARSLRDPLAWIFPPIATGDVSTWDGAWELEAGPWWGCHGVVAAGEVEHTLEGGCEQLHYRGQSRLSGTFTRGDDGFGVGTARWRFDSLWEHYMIYNDTQTTVTVRLLEE